MTTAPPARSLSYADRYAAISARLLREAQAELDAGDLLQASEKAWGAAAHAVKSVAEKWGWYHQGHYRLNAAVEFIAHHRGMEYLVNLYWAPNVMHFNYYEHELAGDTLQTAINSTKAFVEEMEKIRAETVPAFQPPDSLSLAQARRLRLLNTEPKEHKARLNDPSLLPPVEPEPPESR